MSGRGRAFRSEWHPGPVSDPAVPLPVGAAAAFFAAVADGATDAVRRMLDDRPQLLAADGDGERAPLVALWAGHPALADELAARAFPLDVHEAAAFDDTPRLAELLTADLGATADWSAAGWQPLHLAARFGRPEAVRQLLDDDAEVDPVSRNGRRCTPLHLAAAAGHVEVVWLLIASGADVNAREAGGGSALHLAASHGDIDTVRALLAAGALSDLADDAGQTPLDVAAPTVAPLLG